MSVLKVNNIQNASGTDAISIGSDGSLSYPNIGRRNLIINGAMQVAQRGTSGTSSGFNSVDRFSSPYETGGTMVITQSQETMSSSDTPFSSGFRHYMRLTMTTAGSDSVDDWSYIGHKIEAQNIASCGWDYTSPSSYITMSMWLRTSVSGTYYISHRLLNTSPQIAYVKGVTLTANTWTKVVYSIPGNASAVINSDNGGGLEIYIRPYVGTAYTDNTVALDTWYGRSGTTQCPDYTHSWGLTAGATFDLTGVQLEVGSVATPFEHRSYGEELALCQRYFVQQNSNNKSYDLIFPAMVIDADDANTCWQPPVSLRVAPTISVSNAAHICINYNTGNNESPVNIYPGALSYPSMYFNLDTNTAVLTTGQMVFLAFTNNTSGGYIRFDAEL